MRGTVEGWIFTCRPYVSMEYERICIAFVSLFAGSRDYPYEQAPEEKVGKGPVRRLIER